MFTALPSIRDTLFQWARKTSTSFSDISLFPKEAGDSKLEGDGLIYKLKHWPELPQASKTAAVLRTLSVMSHRPVNRRWILATSKMGSQQVDGLLQKLVDDGAVEVIDGSRFAAALPV
ncbi:MAG TPA: hypothetical protein VK981_05005 [Ramlibacter sp.]|nr:hypothetical protein [Ramlibacter sp.]